MDVLQKFSRDDETHYNCALRITAGFFFKKKRKIAAGSNKAFMKPMYTQLEVHAY